MAAPRDERRRQLGAQLEWYWDAMLRPRLEGLTDEEYFWEPVADCWSVRRTPEGRFIWETQSPEPTPPPFTTIAWRMAHIGDLLVERANHHFGDRLYRQETVDWPGSADAAIAFMELGYAQWMQGLETVTDADLEERRPGPPDTLDGEFPFADVILHVNREVIHHGAEVALLRDLYRAGGASGLRRPT